MLALLGLGYCLGTMQRASSRLLLVVFAVTAAGTALLSPYPYVPITRMASMVIPFALMAGLGAKFLLRTGALSLSVVGGSKARGDRVVGVLAVLGVAVLALNAWQFWIATPKVYHHTQEAVAIGAMRSDECKGEPGGLIMVGRSTVPLLKPALESYNPGGAIPHLLDHADARAGVALPLEPPRCVIFLNPEDNDIQSFKNDLSERFPDGRFVDFSSRSGKAAVEIFRAGG